LLGIKRVALIMKVIVHAICFVVRMAIPAIPDQGSADWLFEPAAVEIPAWAV